MRYAIGSVTFAATTAMLLTGNPVLAQGSRELQELRAQIKALQDRISQLEAQQGQAPGVPPAAPPGPGAPVPTPPAGITPEVTGPVVSQPQPVSPAAAPKVASTGNERVKVTVFGQINRGVLFHNDGKQTDVYNVDNNNSSTRLGLLGEARVSPDWTVNSALEFDLRSNSSTQVSRASENGNGADTPTLGPFRIRRAEVGVANAQYGTLLLGRGSTATDGIAENDLSGTALASYASSFSYVGGNLQFSNAAGRTATDPTYGTVFDDFDGFRDDRLRYDTPIFAGLQGSTSFAQGGYWDVALRYTEKIEGISVVAGVGYAKVKNTNPSPLASGNVNDRLAGSVAALLPNGLNALVSLGRADAALPGRDDPTTWYAKLGYRAKLFEIGDTAFSVDGQQTFDRVQNGDKATRYGIQATQFITPAATEIYADIERRELKRDNADFEDAILGLAGARVQF